LVNDLLGHLQHQMKLCEKWNATIDNMIMHSMNVFITTALISLMKPAIPNMKLLPPPAASINKLIPTPVMKNA
jgi:hypothetical protein